jgi:hypothetical protein
VIKQQTISIANYFFIIIKNFSQYKYLRINCQLNMDFLFTYFLEEANSPFLELEVLTGIPKKPLKVYHLILFHADTLCLQCCLHEIRRREVHFAREQTLPVDHPVSRDIKLGTMVKYPTYDTGSPAMPQEAGNRTIGTHPSGRNKPDYLDHVFSKFIGS